MQRLTKYRISANNLLSSVYARRFSEFIGKVELPKLNYKYEELEPILSKELVELHHSKHHQTYITNYIKQVADLKTAIDNQELEKIVNLQGGIKFNGGSHINHTIYWTNLAPIKSKYK